MHHIELITSILIASTTFVGLTGVVVGQTLSGNHLSVVKRKKLRARLVYLPLLFGVITTMFSVGWLASQNPWFEILAMVFFGFQMVSFWGIAVRFWVIER